MYRLTFTKINFMKSLYLFLFLLCCTVTENLSSQSATSIANGPWLSPFTWNCTCVPTPGYTVTINHQVILNTSFQLPSGGITVNAGGSLIQDVTPRDMQMNGGFFVNHGTVDFRYLFLQSGSFNNTDTLRLKSFASYGQIDNSGIVYQVDSFYNLGYLHNSGTVVANKFQNSDTLINGGLFIAVDSFFNTGYLRNSDSVVTPTFLTTGTLLNTGAIAGVDSFTNIGQMTNTITGRIQADSVLNMGSLHNNGTILTTAFASLGTIVNNGRFTFEDAYNLNVFTNSDSLVGLRNFYNTGRFVNSLGGVVALGGSFLNADSIYHDASFFNNGIMVVDSNWYNADTISGEFGSFVVSYSTGNSGLMVGSFDFCDLTPPSQAPYIDTNYGTISAQITWCNPQSPHAAFVAMNVCEGTPVTFSNNSTGVVSSFYWDFDDGTNSTHPAPTHTYSSPGTYDVMLVVGNGISYDTAYHSVTVYSLPASPTLTVSGDTVTCNETATAYTWYLNGIWQSGITAQSFKVTQSGYYSVQITNANDCISEKSDSVFANVILGIAELQNEKAVQIFPNPFTQKTTLSFYSAQSAEAVLSVSNLLGQQIYVVTKTTDAGEVNRISIDLPSLAKGVYIYQLKILDKRYTGRIIHE